jgi:ATP-dependent DNA helicase RecG
MNTSLEQVHCFMTDLEGERLEFKEARKSYPFDKLLRYCAAIANEGGGRIILGITDKRPRKIVGTQAFSQPERTRAGLMEKLRLNVGVDDVRSSEGRILVFTVPPRPIGIPIQADGIYWTRRGDSLVPMTEDQLRDIFDEIGHDFSADICPETTFDDLDPAAVEDFRNRWVQKSGNRSLATLHCKQVLQDTEARFDDPGPGAPRPAGMRPTETTVVLPR